MYVCMYMWKITKLDHDLNYYVIFYYTWTISILEPNIYKFSTCVDKKLCVLDLIVTAYYLFPTHPPKISAL